MSKSVLEISKDVQKIKIDDNFIYNFILAFGKSNTTITRLKSGDYNFSKNPNEIIWKNEMFYSFIKDNVDLHFSIDKMQNDNRIKKYKIRFVIAMNSDILLAYDTKTKDSLEIELKKLSNHVDFFMPWAGLEKSKIENGEAIADIKASEKMARLYDEIVHNNEIKNDKQIHDLNIFFSRLLFCFFC